MEIEKVGVRIKMPKVIDDVIQYVKNFQAQGYSVEYKKPENPELVLVHIVPNRLGVVVVEASLDILNKIKLAIENN